MVYAKAMMKKNHATYLTMKQLKEEADQGV